MSADNRYAMLLASLPHLSLPRQGGAGVPFVVDRTPINRIRLEQRLAWLEEEDLELLTRIENVLAWEQLPVSVSDKELVGSIEELLEDLDSVRHTELFGIVKDRYELRTIVAGMRSRRVGENAPARGEVWGERETCARLARNWNTPGFGLGSVHTWIPEAERLLRDDDSVGFERVLITASWRQLETRGFGHHFDLVAVAAWLLRWGLIDRCVRHDAVVAAERFDSLLDAARGPHPLRFSNE